MKQKEKQIEARNVFILIGEGKFDEIFFSTLFNHIMEEQNIEIKYYSSHKEIGTLLKTLSSNLSQRLRYYNCFFWGDNGKKKLIKYSFRILRQILGNLEGNSKILIVRDGDQEGNHIISKMTKEMKNYLENPKKFQKPPRFQISDSDMINIKKNRHHINIECKLVPKSLEYQICRETIQRNNLRIEYQEKDIHYVLDEISHELSHSKEEIIRESVLNLKDEKWCKDISQMFYGFLSVVPRPEKGS